MAAMNVSVRLQSAETRADKPCSGMKTDPYWWDAAPRRYEPVRPLPATTDVAIIGSGFTGLSAALTLARGGREVTILEQDSVGHGASSRNFGMLGRQHKQDLTSLIKSVGVERAKTLYEACNKAFAFVNALIEREKIDCLLAPSGRFVAANTTAHLDALEAELAARKLHFGHAYRMVSRAEQASELVTESFVGGAVIPEHKTVHPGLFHNASGRARARCRCRHPLADEGPVGRAQRRGLARADGSREPSPRNTSSPQPTATPARRRRGSGAASCRSAPTSSPPSRSIPRCSPTSCQPGAASTTAPTRCSMRASRRTAPASCSER